MKIEPIILKQCYSHGIATYPHEACGLISGPVDNSGLLTKVHVMPNVMDEYHLHDPKQYPRTSRNGYFIDPAGYLELMDSLREKDHRIKIIYHSHVDADAYFSGTDLEYALWDGEPAHPDVGYLVFGIKERTPAGCVMAVFNPKTRLFEVLRVE